MPTLPKFSQLPLVGQTGERHTWGVFGKDDQLGTVNLLTPERVKRAATLVRTGKVINLSLPLTDGQLATALAALDETLAELAQSSPSQ